MATIDTNIATTAGLRTYDKSATAIPTNNNDLGQQDFLTLMTTQLKNQDPFKPMESGEFLGQMAQFSTVSGIEQVNSTLQTLAQSFNESRLSTASSLIGQQVLVPGSTARPDANGEIHGAVELAERADKMTITFIDPATGGVLNSVTKTNLLAGQVPFEWTDVPAEIVQNNKPVKLVVSTQFDGVSTTVGASVFAKVMSVDMTGTGPDVTLQVQDYGAINSLEISALR